MLGVQLEALVYDMLPLEQGAGKRCSQYDSKHWFTTSLGGRCRKAMLGVRLKALVYDILPLEAGAGKRCLECDSKHWFTTSLLWNKVPESHAWRTTQSTGLRHLSSGGRCRKAMLAVRFKLLVYDILPPGGRVSESEACGVEQFH